MEGLYEKLQAYAASDWYRFHMPGHKGNIRLLSDPYAVDVTEVDGLDDLHHAATVIAEAQERAARLFGAQETHFLVGGSTCGILSAIAAACRRGSHILAARNCHKSVYHAIELGQLNAHWLYPTYDSARGIFGSVSPEMVTEALAQEERICAVVLTSPTYDGIVSDIAGIAQAVHARGAVLIVDQAHGAHFGLHGALPESAVTLGADYVITSVHKTLPALTQSALLHVCGPRADRSRLRKYLSIYQSSSPSYILMAGIEQCVCLLERNKEALFSAYLTRIDRLRERLAALRALRLVNGTEEGLTCFRYDRTRIVISTERCRLGGAALYQMVRERFHLQPEMAAEQYVVFLTSVADTEEGFDRLAEALTALDGEMTGQEGTEEMPPAACTWPQPRTVLSIADADLLQPLWVPLEEAAGYVSLDYVYLYPPGIPVLIPGEAVTKEVLGRILLWKTRGFALHGMQDMDGKLLAAAACGKEEGL